MFLPFVTLYKKCCRVFWWVFFGLRFCYILHGLLQEFVFNLLQPENELSSGFCVRINTGAPIPPGADAVVQVEDTVLVKDTDEGKTEVEIRIEVPPKVGQDIRLEPFLVFLDASFHLSLFLSFFLFSF